MPRIGMLIAHVALPAMGLIAAISCNSSDGGNATGTGGAGGTGPGGVGGASGGAAGASTGGSSGATNGGTAGAGGSTGGSGGSTSGGGAGQGGTAGSGGSGASGGTGATGGAGGGKGGASGTGGSSASGGASGSGGTAGSGGSAGANDAGGPPSAAQLLALVQNCATVVSSHKYATDDGRTSNIDICSLKGAVFWKADMDIDCDGRDVGDGKCPGDDCCYQPQTAFTNKMGQPLAASVTPYVVIPNDFSYSGLKGGNVVAVIYGGKIQYAVFGDTGPDNIIGEASYACAEKLGINPDPGNGGTDSTVVYIVFAGTGTGPVDIENQTETQTLGEKLAAALIQNN